MFPPFAHHEHEIQRKTRRLSRVEGISISVSVGRGVGSILIGETPSRLIAYDFEADGEELTTEDPSLTE
jgi:hypothetical protein